MLYDDFIKLFRFSAESLAMAKRFGIYIHMYIREQSLQLFSGYTDHVWKKNVSIETYFVGNKFVFLRITHNEHSIWFYSS